MGDKPSRSPEAVNILYYGDNLDVLRRHVGDESVDLVYLDPPFNSNADYNVLFADHDVKAAAQIKVFEDTWTWDAEAAKQYEELVAAGGKVADVMEAFRKFLGQSDMMAYLTMMAPRLQELRRTMKTSASIYLHCDPTASHYLKALMDAVFGPENFRNEIIWQRSTGKALQTNGLPNNHDVLLCYGRGGEAYWNDEGAFLAYDEANLDEKTASKYTHRDEKGRLYTLDNLQNPNPDRPNLTYEFLGHHKVWRWTKDRMQKAYEEGLVIQPSPGSIPRMKRFLDEQRGRPLGDVWTDIPPLNSQAQERLGYPTQKPEALLERIVAMACPAGGTVLDPFCGCGTTIAVAERTGRRWIGIDITHLAVNLIKHRLTGFGAVAGKDYKVVGEPTTLQDAAKLAEEDKYQFQFWSLGLVGARPVEEKKGADKGIDGRRRFFARPGKGEKPLEVIYSVKAGQNVPANAHRDLLGVIEREKAAFGVLVTFADPSGTMMKDAAAMGVVNVEGYDGLRRYPRVQIVTVAELLAGKTLDLPAFATGGGDATFKMAPKRKTVVVSKVREPRLGEFKPDEPT